MLEDENVCADPPVDVHSDYENDFGEDVKNTNDKVGVDFGESSCRSADLVR